jgi:dihydrodipicolinate synthase/N-acetylneuraminate lyase
LGCDGILVLPPYFLKLGPEDIVAHYEAIADAVDLPMALYNIPGNAGNDLTPRLVDRLADIRTVVALKESSGNFNQFCKTLSLCRDRLRVFVGPAALYGVGAMAMGAAGYIDTVPNLWGRESVAFFDAAAAGDKEKARVLQEKAIVMRELLNANGRNYYAALKAAMNLVGLPGGLPRRPLRSLAPPHLAELRSGLERLDFKCSAAATE